MGEETKKPSTTWQEMNNETGILTVHVSDDPNSEIYFQGLPEDYDGTATEPAAPTGQYEEKHKEKVE